MPVTTNLFEQASAGRAQRDDWEDWEDWEDDDSETGLYTNDLLVDLSDGTTGQSSKGTQHRFSVQKPMRVKSKGRQKAQNAKAGIKLVTDMTKFRRSASQQQQAQLANRGGQNETRGKFVDTAALLALEGEPTSASVGSFSWLKRKPGNLRKDKLGKKATHHTSSDLSPAARPIVIGISVPSDDISSHQVSPQTAVLETPLDVEGHPLRQATKAGRAASSVYSQQPANPKAIPSPGLVSPGLSGTMTSQGAIMVILTRKGAADQTPESSIWLNLTDFPPIPTGVLTVAGPDNVKAVSGCLVNSTETAWTCSLPKEDQDSVAPFLPNQPEFIFNIQYDNDTRALWNVSEAQQPEPTSTEDSGTELDRRSIVTAPGITPIPDPPSVAEISFLGNTTDDIESDEKAGEPTPFYISLLSTVDETVGPSALGRRQGFNNAIGGSEDNGTANSGLSGILPAPKSNSDGTGAPARLFPLAKQQPLRLFDRGLETEHYGFYTYFDKRTYLTDKDDAVSADKDGGSRLADARYVVTFTETRFLVQMWTRRVNTTELLGNGTTPGTDGTSVFSMPGTMPYPITVVEDIHGGNPTKKMTFYYGVDADQQINTTQAGLITIDKGFDGTVVNDRSEADLTLGGVDGGTGGCKCEWQNFRTL
ncbi:putative glycoprotease family protein [Eutypa lata UCREL1]|uniref:Putative glycoprotease family protein n=1 Tax=Eutypa lata (strain UCR-EL1) TaxID=1287681 RepID=M7U086_EUTLA|nr:putative glycoprotease family protein [Eutypa lata UCREL1]